MTVMMWQPISSAWAMFSTSRGLAQISSAAGATAIASSDVAHQRDRVAPGVGDAAGEHRDVARRAPGERARDLLHLARRS